MMRGVHARYAREEAVARLEALGQLGGSGDLEQDISLCAFQTIEPAFQRYLPRHERILEAGAGRGRWVFYLRRLGYDVLGIDVADGDIAHALRHDPRIPITRADVLHTEFPDASFGAVISLGVLEHFVDGPGPAFAEVRRIIRPGGIFLVTVPTQNLGRILLFNRVSDVKRILSRLRGHKLVFEEYRYSRRRFRALLRSAGFEVLEEVPDDFRPPKNMGLYTDSRFLQHRTLRWELNSAGDAIATALGAISPWLTCSGTLWICRR